MSTQNDIPNLPNLPQSRYENIFNVYQDENKNYFYNLLQTVVIPNNLPANYFTTYRVTYGDTLPFISYKVYGRTDLWWLIAKVNNITNPTIELEPITTLKVIVPNIVSTILAQI
jgi:nucleoid-associated protein YgaU